MADYLANITIISGTTCILGGGGATVDLMTDGCGAVGGFGRRLAKAIEHPKLYVDHCCYGREPLLIESYYYYSSSL